MTGSYSKDKSKHNTKENDCQIDSPTIERCVHDRLNPYTMLNRDLIRDSSISPECRWLIIYLLSLPDNWRISVADLRKRHKKFMGRDKIRKLIKEAIDAGYMRKEEIRVGNLIGGIKYYVSEFKKCLPRPDFEAPQVEAPPDHTLRNKEEKEVVKKRCLYSETENDQKGEEIGSAKRTGMRIEDIFHYSVKFRKDWNTQEIEYAFDALSKTMSPIHDVIHFIEGTIKNLRKRKVSKYLNQREKKWPKPAEKKSTNFKEISSENDMKEQHLVNWDFTPKI